MKNDVDETRLALNTLARKQMIRRLLADILVDINICQLEGWDYREYLLELKKNIDGIVIK